MSYKYNPIPEDTKDILFLEVVKPLHWHNNVKNRVWCDDVPVGAVTWCRIRPWQYSIIDNVPVLKNGEGFEFAVTIENNRYCANFDPSCFKILHTSKQKIKR
jgi:hypothetical protein